MGKCRSVMLGLVTLILLPGGAIADGQLKSDEFAVTYGSRGITSLKRVNDAYDTEYISAGGVLGNVAIQYKAAGDANWTVAREVAAAGEPASGGNTASYSIGTLAPTLPQRSKASGPPS